MLKITNIFFSKTTNISKILNKAKYPIFNYNKYFFSLKKMNPTGKIKTQFLIFRIWRENKFRTHYKGGNKKGS